MSFSLRLKELREKAGMSQIMLAKSLNVGVGSVGMWESTTRIPPAKKLVMIADFFHVSTDYLLGRTDEPNTVNITYSPDAAQEGGDEVCMLQLLNLREEKGKTQQEIAGFLGVTQQAYSRYERGTCELGYEALIKLAKYFDVSVDYLLGNTSYYYPDAVHSSFHDLNENEFELLQLFRNLPAALQKNALDVVRTLSGVKTGDLQKKA